MDFMPSIFQITCIALILAVTIIGGYFPLARRKVSGEPDGFPNGEAFASGVFLALSMIIMLPASFKLFGKAFPKMEYPIASLIAVSTFLILLALEHLMVHQAGSSESNPEKSDSPIIPILMVVLIAIPSFFLGSALGVSGNSTAAVIILLAILLHKGSAGFSLALKMKRSSLSKSKIYPLYCFFAFATPLGIIVGAEIQHLVGGDTIVIIKAIILSLASGVFLYIATVHEFRHSPLIKHCSCPFGYTIMLSGFILTAFVRYLLGNAHHI